MARIRSTVTAVNTMSLIYLQMSVSTVGAVRMRTSTSVAESNADSLNRGRTVFKTA